MDFTRNQKYNRNITFILGVLHFTFYISYNGFCPFLVRA